MVQNEFASYLFAGMVIAALIIGCVVYRQKKIAAGRKRLKENYRSQLESRIEKTIALISGWTIRCHGVNEWSYLEGSLKHYRENEFGRIECGKKDVSDYIRSRFSFSRWLIEVKEHYEISSKTLIAKHPDFQIVEVRALFFEAEGYIDSFEVGTPEEFVIAMEKLPPPFKAIDLFLLDPEKPILDAWTADQPADADPEDVQKIGLVANAG
ncbi:MAG: hypothetical protein WCW77_03185 [Patescibacteria group bacterium]|jgi:hypothetical protein